MSGHTGLTDPSYFKISTLLIPIPMLVNFVSFSFIMGLMDFFPTDSVSVIPIFYLFLLSYGLSPDALMC